MMNKTILGLVKKPYRFICSLFNTNLLFLFLTVFVFVAAVQAFELNFMLTDATSISQDVNSLRTAQVALTSE